MRVAYGAVAAISMTRLLTNGWARTLYADPPQRFAYPGLGFVRPLPPTATVTVVTILGIVAVAVTLGWHTRWALAVFVPGFTWLEFSDATNYLNHYWFMSLLGALLAVAPTDTCWAIRPHPRAVHRWWIWLVRFHPAMVYVFAAVAKANTDWLVHGLPLRLWLPARSDLPLVGPVLSEPVTALVASWAGFVFDASVVPLLAWRRTRAVAFTAVVAFHVLTWSLFPIGVFPWLMIGVATIWFPPDWPDRLRGSRHRPRQPSILGGTRRWPFAAAIAWCSLLAVIPLRHHLIPGDARWTGEGYRFSWYVLRTEKAGTVTFRVVDLATGTVRLDTATGLYTDRQIRAMSTEPELIRQAAHLIATQERTAGREVAVYADAFVSLNGRAPSRLIDPDVDLSREPYRWFGQPWILQQDHDD